MGWSEGRRWDPRARYSMFLAFTLSALPSCAFSEASVKHIERGEISKPLDRVYLLVFQGEVDRYYAEKLRLVLAEAFRPHTGAVTTFLVTGLELDDSAVEADIYRFHPDGILLLKPVGGHRNAMGGLDRVHYAVTLVESNKRRTLWRAKATNEGSPIRMGTRMELMATEIVKNLVWDGVLREASTR